MSMGKFPPLHPYLFSFHFRLDASTMAGSEDRAKAIAHFVRKLGAEDLVVDGPHMAKGRAA